ncbi:glycyl-tRNA synthetase [Isosphaera pallida ATCC 43644]|uniref:Glycine--tRNA ligase n=1 Tax=Isosphaera pallida (strain ATCC 43644 / DSM 9630 / IS1B) TaxID=575540 RepID=E8R568_ISOPI|nr:glycine--tRNA ligase [Isosphaera pallida]ADV63821.1 glycyl-tRNA synthetase [Isosphaera pallida ATCC 43644]
MDMEKLVSLCKRRGFIFPSSEIYGGLNGFWDYGPLGVELKRNIKEAWWRDNVTARDDMVGLDCSIIMNPKVWEASGHVGGFSDPMVDCKATQGRYRADQMYVFTYADPRDPNRTVLLAGLGSNPEEAAEGLDRKAAKMLKIKPAEVPAPSSVTPYLDIPDDQRDRVVGPQTDEPGTLTPPRAFNLMFKTYVGALESASNIAYLRPETAQGIFANFKNVCDTTRLKIPFGIAQIGKSFRNEINPRNFTFRSREFEQMEIEFFCHPDEAATWYRYWRDARFAWYVRHGLRSDRLRLRDHDPAELAFYSTATADIEYAFPFGVSELEGIAHRGDYDLTQHQKFSGKDLSYFDDETKQRFVPHVIEPSAGADRATLAFLCEAYHEDEVGGEARTVLKFHPRLAPIKAAVLPLVKKDGMPEMAAKIYRELKTHYNVFYDEKGAIGRRYRRQDEVGTPFCLTIDGQSLQDGTVTIRDRDDCRQWRVPSANIVGVLASLMAGEPVRGEPAAASAPTEAEG